MSTRPRVVLIDDDVKMLRVLRRLLRGFETLMFASPLAGRQLLLASRVDAVIIHLGMPVLDGLELTRDVRAALGHGAPPFVLHTGAPWLVPADRRESFAAIVEKGWGSYELVDVVSRAMASRDLAVDAACL